MLPTLLASEGKYALLKDGELKGIYDIFQDALQTATVFIPDGRYSIQQIITRPVDLGFRSRALHRR